MEHLDFFANQVVEAILASGQPGLETQSPVEARKAFATGMLAMQTPKTVIGAVTNLVADSAHGPIRMRMYRPSLTVPPNAALPVIVFFHGGGFFLGDLDVFDGQCRRLCQASKSAVISVDYRLAPEHKFPAATDDAFAAIEWITMNAKSLGVDPNRLAVAGDSAGGNLAAVVCLMARDAGAPKISHQILLYPATNLRAEPVDGPFLTTALMRHFVSSYVKSDNERDHWRVSPALAENHVGLPPATIAVCGFDPLHDDGVGYGKTLRRAGVPVQVFRYPGQIHGFLLMDAAIPAAVTAIDEIGRHIQASL